MRFPHGGSLVTDDVSTTAHYNTIEHSNDVALHSTDIPRAPFNDDTSRAR